jgi:hypothetical protein
MGFCLGDGSGVGANMGFQPRWNIAHWRRFRHSRITPKRRGKPCNLIALRVSIYIVVLIFLTGTGTTAEDLSVPGAAV